MYSLTDLESFISRFYPGKSLLIVPYAYPLTFNTLTFGTSQTAQIAIAANADFILTRVRHHAAIAAAAQNVSTTVNPNVRMLVTDSGTNEQFTAAAVDLANYSQYGQAPEQLPYPRIVAGRSNLTVQVTSYEAAVTYSTLDILFEGVLVRAYQ